MITIKECEAAIRPRLSPKRFQHSVCVAEEAKRLARKYGADEEKAAVAGMLHDIMKETPREEQLKILSAFAIMMTTVEEKMPKLLHALSGACYIRHVLGVEDAEILGAVRWHTLGRSGMTLLEKVIFMADFISADRDFPGVEALRVLAYQDLEEAMLEGIRFTLRELLDKEQLVEPHLLDAYNDLLEQVRNQSNTIKK